MAWQVNKKRIWLQILRCWLSQVYECRAKRTNMLSCSLWTTWRENGVGCWSSMRLWRLNVKGPVLFLFGVLKLKRRLWLQWAPLSYTFSTAPCLYKLHILEESLYSFYHSVGSRVGLVVVHIASDAEKVQMHKWINWPVKSGDRSKKVYRHLHHFHVHSRFDSHQLCSVFIDLWPLYG